MQSPCTGLCTRDEEDNCLNCARTESERQMWKDESTTDSWKLNNLIDIQQRLSGLDLDFWNTAYKFRTRTGISLKKHIVGNMKLKTT